MYLVGLKFWKASIFFDEGMTNIGPDAEIFEKILFLNRLVLGFVSTGFDDVLKFEKLPSVLYGIYSSFSSKSSLSINFFLFFYFFSLLNFLIFYPYHLLTLGYLDSC